MKYLQIQHILERMQSKVAKSNVDGIKKTWMCEKMNKKGRTHVTYQQAEASD